MLSEAIYPFEKEPEPFEDEPEGDGVILSEQARAIIDATQDPSTSSEKFLLLRDGPMDGRVVWRISSRSEAKLLRRC